MKLQFLFAFVTPLWLFTTASTCRAADDILIADFEDETYGATRDGKIDLTIFTDRTVYEVFANDGLTYVPIPIIPDAKNLSVEISVTGATQFDALKIHQLEPIWTQ